MQEDDVDRAGLADAVGAVCGSASQNKACYGQAGAVLKLEGMGKGLHNANCRTTRCDCGQSPQSPSAWMISPGVHVISANTTVEAAVRVRPVPAALMDRMATRTSAQQVGMASQMTG